MIMDHFTTVLEPSGSSSIEPQYTTALLLDPTGLGYHLDSKLVAELSAPLPKRKTPLAFLPSRPPSRSFPPRHPGVVLWVNGPPGIYHGGFKRPC